MIAANFYLHLQQGSATVLRLRYIDPETGQPPVDLENYEAVLQIRRDYRTSPALELTSDDDEIEIEEAEGEITCTFPTDKVDSLLKSCPHGQEGWVWGLQIYNPGDKNTTARLLVKGEVEVHPSPVREEP